jgi:RNA polymerase sigma-70 factor (ECF subfamily)
MTEQELWEGIRQSDESAFTQVFDKFHATLYNYGRKLCDDSGLVEDAVQEVFIDIRRLRKNLTPNVSSIKFYLYGSLRRRIHLGTLKTQPFRDVSILSGDDMPFVRDNSESMLVDRETSTLLSQRLNGLSSQCQSS